MVLTAAVRILFEHVELGSRRGERRWVSRGHILCLEDRDSLWHLDASALGGVDARREAGI
jgi:hypothetical protein